MNGQIFNVGSEANNYQLGQLAQIVGDTLPNKVEIEWYGDADTRSYRVSFDKIEALGWKAQRTAEDGVREICGPRRGPDRPHHRDDHSGLVQGAGEWHAIIRQVELYGGMLEL